MNVEIGTEAAQFPEKEFINGILLAVYYWGRWSVLCKVELYFSAYILSTVTSHPVKFEAQNDFSDAPLR